MAGAVQAAGGTVAPGGAGWGEPQAGQRPATEGQGHEAGLSRTSPTRAARAPTLQAAQGRGAPAGRLTHPAHSVARSSPGRRSSCRRPRGRGPHSCRSTCAHSSRQTGSEDSLRTEAGHALGHVPPSSDTHAANASRALSGPVSAAWAHVYPGATPAGSRPFTRPLGQQRPGCPRAKVTQGKGASTLQELPEPARPVGGVWEPPWGGGTL